MIRTGALRWSLGAAAAITLVVGGPVAAGPAPATAGDTAWTSRYNGPANSDDGATSIVVSADGSTVFVAGGGSGTTSGYDFTVVAYRASNGTMKWAKAYDGPGHGYDQATAIGITPDGSTVFVTGASRGTHTKLDYATVAFDASSGTRLWAKRYDGPGHGVDYGTALGVSPDGATVFVTGYSPGSGSGNDYATLAYDAATGSRTWLKRYNGPSSGGDDARGLAVSPDGSTVYVTGSSDGTTGHPDYMTIAYGAATGAQLWLKRYDGPGHYVDLAHAVKVSPDGSTVFVTGESVNAAGGFDYATVAYDATNGTRLWARRYDGPVSRDDYATALSVSPDGAAVFVTGYSVGPAYHFDYATVAYDASTGARLWVKRYNGPGNTTDDANAVAVSPDGTKVLVTGASVGSSNFVEYATVAYDASTGGQLWARRYSGGNGSDYAYALAIRPDGSAVYVTGESAASNGALDFTTIAYSLD